jgi:DNA-binding MarR family transcriptional regulator
MPQHANDGSDFRGRRGGARESRPGEEFRLVRYSHIFASAVREVLELRLLRSASSLPLTLSQFHVLKLMTFNGQHQVSEVASFLGVSPPAATKNIDKLERIGLMVRAQSAGDRRATLLSVTDKGRRLVQRYERLKAERLAAVLEAFEPQEVTRLASLLERFSVALLDLDPGGDGSCLRCAAYLEEGCPVGALRGGCPYRGLKARASRLAERVRA